MPLSAEGRICEDNVDLYLLIAGKNIPVWVYVFIAGMLALGIWSTVRKVRGQIGREAA